MKSILQEKGRQEYVRLNKLFLDAVEQGAGWDELQPLIDQMKSLAVYLQEIPSTLESLNIPIQDTSTESAETQDPVSE